MLLVPLSKSSLRLVLCRAEIDLDADFSRRHYFLVAVELPDLSAFEPQRRTSVLAVDSTLASGLNFLVLSQV